MTAYNLLATIQSTAPSGQPVSFRYAEPRAGSHIVGGSVSLRPLVTGGTAPFAFSVLSGSLPTGLSLATDGLISGTLTTIGDFTAIIQLQDSLGVQYPKSFTFSVYSGYRVVRATPTTGARSLAYSYQLVFADASFDTTGFTFSVLTGSMPSGLSLSSGGLISGTPGAPAVGTTWLTVRGTKASINLDVPISITVTASISLALVNPAGLVNQPFEAQVVVTNGAEPWTMEVTANALPAGLVLNTKTGKITGTPSAFTPSTGATNPTITVTDAIGQSASIAFPFQINQGVRAAAKGKFYVAGDSDEPVAIDFNALLFGGGTDGDIVLDGTNTYPSLFTKVGSAYTCIVEALYANNLTITGSATLRPNGRILYVADTLDLENAGVAAINANILTAASGNTAGIPPPGYFLGGGGQGSNGGIADTTNNPPPPATPAALPYALGGEVGSPGGAGGNTIGGAGQSQGSNNPRPIPKTPYSGFLRPGGAACSGGLAGGAGGGGDGNGVTAGGNGGGSGPGAGCIVIFARRIKRGASTAAATIQANGGKGGDGLAGGGLNRSGGGGATGGGGGFIYVCAGELLGTAKTGAIESKGGDGGLGGAPGSGGLVGGDGRGNVGGNVIVIDMSVPSVTHSTSTAASLTVAGTTSVTL